MAGQASRDAAPRTTEGRIGEVLKRLREQSGVSLRTLAARVGFSASFLSQVENGQVSPSIASLERITAELVATLFDASRRPRPWSFGPIRDLASPAPGLERESSH